MTFDLRYAVFAVIVLRFDKGMELTEEKGARLQVLAQADYLDDGAPSFEDQHINLRRGDIVGRSHPAKVCYHLTNQH